MEKYSSQEIIQIVIPKLVERESFIELLQLVRHYENLHVKSAAVTRLRTLLANVQIRQKDKLIHLLSFEKRLRPILAKPKIVKIPPTLMEYLFWLYYSTLEYIYLGLLNGCVKYDDIKIPKADIDDILKWSLKLEQGETLNIPDEIREANISCIRRLLNKLYESRLSKWNIITKGTISFRKMKFSLATNKKILHALLDFCDPTIAIEVETCNDAVIQEIKNLSSWLEKYIFLRYLSNQVCIVSYKIGCIHIK